MTSVPQAARRRRRGPGPLPVMLAALATFLVVLALLAVQLQAGHDPALGNRARVALVPGKNGGAPVVTRTSGGGQAAAAPAGKHAPAHPVTTRTSGGGGEGGDDE